jgi:hypothetical protein
VPTGSQPEPDIESREYTTAQIDRLAVDLAEQLEAWFSRDREDTMGHYHLANKITNTSRALSAHTQWLASLNWKDYNRGR